MSARRNTASSVNGTLDFSTVQTAYTTLTAKESRTHYQESLHGGGGTPAAQKKVAAVLDTLQDVHRAEVAFRRKDYPDSHGLLLARAPIRTLRTGIVRRVRPQINDCSIRAFVPHAQRRR